MSDTDLPDLPDVPDDHPASDGLEERGQGAGRLLGEGAEQGITADEVEPDTTGGETVEGDALEDDNN